MDRVECAVIGAGVVGLAVARALAAAGREVLVIEAAARIGSGISARNSEVIHAGIYYRPDSLKARLCIEGREALYRYCGARGVPHRRSGKLIVASGAAEVARLEALAANAAAAGVTDLVWLDRAGLDAREPALVADAALWSPSTGIIDSHGLMLALQGEAEDHGAMVALSSPVVGGAARPDGIMLEIGGAEPTRIVCPWVVNCAGLAAAAVAGRIDGVPADRVPRLRFARGHYFGVVGTRVPFRHLIYPTPVDGGLGIHLTLDLAGRPRFGPDVEWVEDLDYDVSPARAPAFAEAIRRYWPGLPDGALVPDYAGIRPKLVGPEAPPADFRIDRPADHGVPGLINLFGIESPGLTACLAIGRLVADEVTCAGAP